MTSIYKDIVDKLPSSSINGKRAYVLRKLGLMMKYPSESRKNELEDLVDDISIDYQASDTGEELEVINE